VQELSKEGKPTNSRTYTTTLSTDSHGPASIRTNFKIPIVVSETSSNNASSPNVQFQYQDIGVNIDAMRAREVGHQLSVDLTANITSVAENLDARLHEPIIRQNKWQAIVLIPIGKATVCSRPTLSIPREACNGSSRPRHCNNDRNGALPRVENIRQVWLHLGCGSSSAGQESASLYKGASYVHRASDAM